jgi:Zn-finger nucleic acid-binding protein
MNIPEALHCIGCGAELGLMPVAAPGQKALACPRCVDVLLDAFRSGDDTLHDCPRCGGQFVPSPVVAEMVRRQAAQVDALKPKRPGNPLSEKLVYVRCPECQSLMLRRNFGKTSGIIVDVCAVHGFWFDRGELAAVLAFVGHGGLNRSEATIQSQTANAAWTRQAPARLSDDLDQLVLEDLQDAANAFRRWLRSMLR